MNEHDSLRSELVKAEEKLAEAQLFIRAIQQGDVEAAVVPGPDGKQIFTLKDAEFAYRALVEAMNEGAATLTVDGTVLYCNQRLSHLLGIPREQIIGCPVTKLVSNETSRIFEALLAKARRGEPVTTGMDLQSAEGKSISIQVSLREMMSVVPTALAMVVTDLTETKARDEIIAAGKLATLILESAAEAIAVCDEAGTVIAGNQALESLCGCNPLFQPFNTVLPLKLADGTETPEKDFLIMDAVRGRTPKGQGVILRRKGARAISLLLSASLMRSSFSVAGCVVTLTDITERKLAEEALLRSEKLASVGRMAATIAHEINNPLEAVGNLLYLAMMDTRIAPEIRSYLDRAVEELDRVSHITQQALAFHRDTGSPGMIDLRDVVDGVLKLFARRLEAKGIQVKTSYFGDCHVQAMSGEIRQVIANLLSNSMDAECSGGRIEMRLLRVVRGDGAQVVRFCIADTGTGITLERRKRIFEPFFTTKEMVGTGLGLWVSKQILDKHGASIRVRSLPGKGTVFAIVFQVDGSGIKS